MQETDIRDFWQRHPCGDDLMGGLTNRFGDDLETFFREYDRWRYDLERHIPACLDEVPWRDKRVLEIGLGQGAESEQLIRRGAKWSGLDLTAESPRRVRARLTLRQLPFEDIQQGSVLAIPHPDHQFDYVFSHGVLHHVPEVRQAAAEIRRVLKSEGELVIMLYARHSLNYWLSIALLRRLGLLGLMLSGKDPGGLYHGHLENARRLGLWRYLRMENFIHRNTDGPENPYSKVYGLDDVRRDFEGFEVLRAHKHFLHAPPLPLRRLGLPDEPLAGWLGWHLWVHLRPRA